MIRWVELRLPVAALDEATHPVRFARPTVTGVEEGERYDVEGSPCADAAMSNRSGFNQAAVGVPGAVRADGIKSCVFDRCTFAHLGTYGLDLSHGCQNNRVTACVLTDLGAGGVKIGETRVRP